MTREQRLAEAESDAVEMMLNGTPEQHREALDLVDAIKAEPVILDMAPQTWGAWGEQTEEQARRHAVRRALETSAEREERAARWERYLLRVTAEMDRIARMSTVEFMADLRAKRGPCSI